MTGPGPGPGRRAGIHPTASIGGPPEHRDWVDDPGRPYHAPEIDPTALLNAFVVVDGGCKSPTRVGARTFVMAHVYVGHDVQVGADCELASHTTLGGWVVVGDRVKIGLGAVVLPFRRIGDGAVIGAGAVVTRNVPPGEVWAGNPARCTGPKNEVPFTER